MELTLEIDWEKTGSYTDEADNLRALNTRRGRSIMATESGLENIEAGELWATLTNTDGRYDAYNTASPLYGHIKPARPIRLLTTEGGLTRPVFAGYLTDLRPTGIGGTFATLRAKDGLAFLDRPNCNAGSTQPNYPVSQAIEDLLTQSGWPLISSVTTFPFTWPLTLGSTAIENNGDTIDSWTPDPSKKVLTAIREIAQAFAGMVYVTASGSLGYRARDSARPTKAIIDASMIDPEIEPYMPWDDIFNDVRVTPTVGAEQIATDSVSDDEFYRQTMSIDNNAIVQSATQAGMLANYLIMYLAEEKHGLRVRMIDQFITQFGLELGDRIRATIPSKSIDNLFQIGLIEHEWLSPLCSTCRTTLALEPDFYEVAGLQVFPFTWPLRLGW